MPIYDVIKMDANHINLIFVHELVNICVTKHLLTFTDYAEMAEKCFFVKSNAPV